MADETPQRDETHVEQHGDGDVNINPAPSEPEQPAEQPEPQGDDGDE